MKQYFYILPGDAISKKNSKNIIMLGKAAARRPIMVPSSAHRIWLREAKANMVGQLKPNDPLESAEVVLTFFPSTRRVADLTNKSESVMDLFVECAVLKDDNWFIVGDIRMRLGGVDRECPRVEVLITTNQPE